MSELDFKYIFDDNYNPQYVNGAFGGIGPQGEIVIHFFCERGAIPYKVKHTLDDNGKLGKLVTVKPEDIENLFVRYIQSGIILDREHALNIYNWLGTVLGESNEK